MKDKQTMLSDMKASERWIKKNEEKMKEERKDCDNY